MGWNETVGPFTSGAGVGAWFNSVGGYRRPYQGNVYTLNSLQYTDYPRDPQPAQDSEILLQWVGPGFDSGYSLLVIKSSHSLPWSVIANDIFFSGPAFWPAAADIDNFGIVARLIFVVTSILGYYPREGGVNYHRRYSADPTNGHLFEIRGDWVAYGLEGLVLNGYAEGWLVGGAYSDYWGDPGVDHQFFPPWMVTPPFFYEATFKDAHDVEFTQRLYARSDSVAKQLVNGWASKSRARWTALKKLSRVLVSATGTQTSPAAPNFSKPAVDGSSVKRKGRFVYLTNLRRSDIRFELPSVVSDLVNGSDPKSTVDPLSSTTRAMLRTGSGVPASRLKAIRYDERCRRR